MSRLGRGASRVVIGVGFVLAMGAAVAAGPSGDAVAPGRGEVPWGTARELTEVAEALDGRAASLQAREAALVEREADMAAIEAQLTERTTSLTALRVELETLLAGVDAEDAARVDDLVRRVEPMREGQAAAMLAEMSPALAVVVLRKMSAAKAGKALSKMPPRVAAGLGERMAAPVDLPVMP